MIRSLYTSVSGLIALENRQSNIINNINNVNTNGFKSDELIMKSFKDVMLSNNEGKNSRKVNLGTLSSGVAIDEVTTKHTQGLLKQTSNSTDFAIDGRGFFIVDRITTNGVERYYTRDGNFRVGNNGYLITSNGDYVIGENKNTGNLEPIFVGTNKFNLDVNNNILMNGNSTYRLGSADFTDYSSLKKIGDNLYKGENPIYNADVWMHQGFIESSNVSLSNEMTEMITTMRAFESNQKMIQIIDSTLSKAANEIGTVR